METVPNGSGAGGLHAVVVDALLSRIRCLPLAAKGPLTTGLCYLSLGQPDLCRRAVAAAGRLDGPAATARWAIRALAGGRTEDAAAVLLDDAIGEEAARLRRALCR